jgi:hypothetical protein
VTPVLAETIPLQEKQAHALLADAEDRTAKSALAQVHQLDPNLRFILVVHILLAKVLPKYT